MEPKSRSYIPVPHQSTWFNRLDEGLVPMLMRLAD